MKPRAALALLAVGLAAMAAGFIAWQKWQANQPAQIRPDLVLQGIDGQPHRLSEWNGKLLLLNFWATWCAPCLKEIPLLVKTQERLGPQGLQIVGVAMDQPEPVRAFIQRLRMNYPVLVGEGDVANAMDALGDELGALPFSVLIAPDGRILRRVSGDLSEEELDDLLAGNIQVH